MAVTWKFWFFCQTVCLFGLYSDWTNPELFKKVTSWGCGGYVLFCFRISVANWRRHQNAAPYEVHTLP